MREEIDFCDGTTGEIECGKYFRSSLVNNMK